MKKLPTKKPVTFTGYSPGVTGGKMVVDRRSQSAPARPTIAAQTKVP